MSIKIPEKEQEAFEKVTKEVANLERGWTQEDARKFEENAKANGCEIVTLSKEDKEAMQEKAKELYKNWESKYFPGLVSGIQRLQ